MINHLCYTCTCNCALHYMIRQSIFAAHVQPKLRRGRRRAMWRERRGSQTLGSFYISTCILIKACRGPHRRSLVAQRDAGPALLIEGGDQQAAPPVSSPLPPQHLGEGRPPTLFCACKHPKPLLSSALAARGSQRYTCCVKGVTARARYPRRPHPPAPAFLRRAKPQRSIPAPRDWRTSAAPSFGPSGRLVPLGLPPPRPSQRRTAGAACCRAPAACCWSPASRARRPLPAPN